MGLIVALYAAPSAFGQADVGDMGGLDVIVSDVPDLDLGTDPDVPPDAPDMALDILDEPDIPPDMALDLVDDPDTADSDTPIADVPGGDAAVTDSDLALSDTASNDAASSDAVAGADQVNADSDGDGGGLCSIAPPINVDTTLSLSFDAEGARALDTYVRFDATGSLSSSNLISTGGCEIGLEPAGDFEVCAALLGDEVCTTLPLGGSGNCPAPRTCDEGAAPQLTCDVANYCCAGEALAEVDLELDFVLSHRVGAWSCRADPVASLTGSFSASSEFGPGCDCSNGQSHVEGEVTLGTGGDIDCTLSVFDGLTQVTANGSACASASLSGPAGCEQDQVVDGGAELILSIPAAQIEWLQIGGMTQTWSTDSACP